MSSQRLSQSMSIRLRNFSPVAFWAMATMAGCFHSLDPSRIPCQPGDKTTCPSGYACTQAGNGWTCARPIDAGSGEAAVASGIDSSAVDGVNGPQIDSPTLDLQVSPPPEAGAALDGVADGRSDSVDGGGTGETGGMGGSDAIDAVDAIDVSSERPSSSDVASAPLDAGGGDGSTVVDSSMVDTPTGCVSPSISAAISI